MVPVIWLALIGAIYSQIDTDKPIKTSVMFEPRQEKQNGN